MSGRLVPRMELRRMAEGPAPKERAERATEWHSQQGQTSARLRPPNLLFVRFLSVVFAPMIWIIVMMAIVHRHFPAMEPLQDHPQQSGFPLDQRPSGQAGHMTAGLTGPGNQNHTIHVVTDNDRISDRHDGRRINDDMNAFLLKVS